MLVKFPWEREKGKKKEKKRLVLAGETGVRIGG